VISLDGVGKLGDRIRQLGIPVYEMGMKPSLHPRSLVRLVRTARRLKPDLIQGWMYHGNLAAQIAAMFTARPVSVFWNIRQSLYSLDYEKPATARVIKLGARLSHWPAKTLNNSRTSVAQHSVIGYQTAGTVVIPNGFDTELFAPSEEARRTVRSELGVALDTFLIGLIARYHPMKDHQTFLLAAGLLLKDHPETQFVLAGKDVNWNNAALRSLIQDLGMVERVHLLGERLDMPRLTAALDIASLSSAYEEGFPNVIGEAMACGVPCVVSDVSDSPWIVGDSGRVVPPRNPAALAKSWQDLIELGPEGRKALGETARSRVIDCFSLASVVEQYERLYESVAAERENGRLKSNVNVEQILTADLADQFGENASGTTASHAERGAWSSAPGT
jgi:glycosyltransferase involved in cell wall biosynthesis